MTSSELTEQELKTVLALIISFLGFEDQLINDLGYRMLLIYSGKTNDYKPLYEISLNRGLIPIAQFIYDSLDYDNKFGNLQTEINEISNLKYKLGNTFRTVEQKNLIDFVNNNEGESKILIAPTSYGKTELIIDMVKKNPNGNICILTPTKSLLAQTKKRILKEIGLNKVITQPEMYTGNESRVVAVLTQERLLRLLQQNEALFFDLLIVDEAHNLLEKFDNSSNKRSVLLASVIILSFARNKNLICNYLTPFLKSPDSLEIKYTNLKFEPYSVEEHVKSEWFYFHDTIENKSSLYDQYLNEFIELTKTTELIDDSRVVLSKASSKNIIYLNKPKNTEEFAKELSNKLEIIENKILSKAVKDIREYVHPCYNLANFLEKGIIYHHGSVPESIRFFIENLFTTVNEMKYLITTSTLLEGVNIPAIKMFILDPHKGRSYLSPSAFKNLIGRVCRFSEIFNEKNGSMDYLMPEIHLVKGKYCNADFNAERFSATRKMAVSSDFEDINLNPLMQENDVEDDLHVGLADEFLENLSGKNIIPDYQGYGARTLVGELCYQNNVTAFNIAENEDDIMEKINGIHQQIGDLDIMFQWLDHLFFSKIMDDFDNDNLKRLKHEQARNFYKMLISWRIRGLKTSDMVLQMMNHWSTLEEGGLVFVGKWGDEKRGGHRELWTNIGDKNEEERINLAIVRLKEEYDFIDNEIVKYIEIANSLEIIEEELYLKIKYGTSKVDKIALLNSGLSNSIVNLLYDNYEDYYEIDIIENNIIFNDDLIQEMSRNKENGILIAELEMNSPLS